MALLRSEAVRGFDVEDTPIFREVAEAWAAGRYPVRAASPTVGRHHWMHTQLPAEEAPVGRHGDDDHDGTVNQADPDWLAEQPLPAPPEPVTPLGPDDPEDEAYSRSGDGEPARWPEPSDAELHALHEAACDVDPAWLALVAQPIAEGPR